MLPVLVVPKDVTPERVHVEIVDTPGAESKANVVDEELAKADVIVLAYAVNDENSQKRVSAYWLKKFRNQQLKAPVILVGNKIDTRGGINDPSAASKMEEFIKPIMDTYREVDVCIECSAKTVSNISEVFYFAQKAVLHPTGPLYDVDKHALKPPAAAALRRIFKICDKDRDGGLNDKELNEFQYTCFNQPLAAEELAGVKKVVQDNRKDDGIRPDGSISVEGFIYLHTLFVQKGRLETTWIVLRKFGYDDDMRLELDEKAKIVCADDQSVELTMKGRQFITDVFLVGDKDKDRMLSPAELKNVFADHPDGAFHAGSDGSSAEVIAACGEKPDYLTLDSFLARWSAYVLDRPNDALLSLLYLGFTESPQSAFRITKSRKRDRYNKTVSRQVFNVLVLGDDYPEKSDIIRGLANQSAKGVDTPGLVAVSAISDAENAKEEKRYIVMRDARQITPDSMQMQRSELKRADVLCIAFNGASHESFEYAKLLWAAIQEKKAEVKIPVVFVCSIEHVDNDLTVVNEADAFCHEYSLPSPVRVSIRDMETGNLYQDLLGVAMHPEVACPDYYESADSRMSTSKTLLQVAAGTIAISGMVWGAKRLYDYYKTKPSSN